MIEKFGYVSVKIPLQITGFIPVTKMAMKSNLSLEAIGMAYTYAALVEK